jgi:phenylacetate-coenzyme A ligase PaaK-like adenylate-forming protein
VNDADRRTEVPDVSTILAFLATAEPEALEQMGQAALLEAFRTAAADVPAYRERLRRHGLDPSAITDLATFRARVPITDKASVFEADSIDRLCRNGRLEPIKSVVPSSGRSGAFAFSVDTAEGTALAAKTADLAFEYALQISQRRTFLVNTYPMGLQVPTSMPVANTGVNVDVALGIIRAMARHYAQLVVVGQPLFVKHLVEEGVEQGIEWGALNTTLVIGGESFSESWRTYISRLVGIPDPDSPDGRLVASSMGTGELGLNLFHEVPETIHIIRRAYHDRGLHRALFGTDVIQTPHLFVYYPMRTFIEELPLPGSPVGELAVSHVAADHPMPLMRYRTGDLVRILPYRRIEEALRRHAPDLAPPGLRLPCAAVFGRLEGVEVHRVRIAVEAVKEALFRDPALAGCVTGFFHLAVDASRIRVDVQLRRGITPPSGLDDRLLHALHCCVAGDLVWLPCFHRHDDYPLPTTYERKHRYVLPAA